MNLLVRKNKIDTNLYIVKSIRNGKKVSTVIIQKCGKLSNLKKIYPDPIAHFTEVAKQLTIDDKKNQENLIINFSQTKEIDNDKNVLFNAGYLFLKKIYYSLNLDKFCNNISSKLKIKYDLNDILEKLIYSRVIYPSSKLATFEQSKKFVEQPDFEIHDVYRALDVLSDNIDDIQAFLYKQSENIIKRNTDVLYYDVTNFFFECEQEDEFRKYGRSKEHRPNPIVQLGLFIDGNGIPLAFSMTNGSENEQLSLKPLEQKIIEQFRLSKFIVCTDAGLNSYNNKYFNSIANRGFVCTQSIKKLKGYLQDWVFEDKGWNTMDGEQTCISNLDINEDTIIHKSRWINDEGKITLDNGITAKTKVEQKLVITYSSLYKRYQQVIRNEQIERARKIINCPAKFDQKNVNDCKRFIKNYKVTSDGEIAKDVVLELDYNLIAEESKYDGFYALVSNLEKDDKEIVAINHFRWHIEDNFRILKSELKGRPVYLKNENRIKAHFLTCFLALTFYRILEYKLGNKYSCHDIIQTLKDFQLLSLKGMGFTPAYKKTKIIDDLQNLMGIHLTHEGISNKKLKQIITKI